MTAPSYAPPDWSLHGSRQIKNAWQQLASLYDVDPSHPVIAGCRAAAEWTLGESPVAPVTNERTTPTHTAVQTEASESAMTELGIRLGDVAYARGASAWLYWWLGVQDLPPWLRR